MPRTVKHQLADPERMREELRELAQKISAGLAELDSAQSKELLSDFVSELFLSVADQDRRADRRQKQAEGIAAAKAKGVRFGRPARPLPDNFEEARLAWREGRMSLREAAELCCMTKGSFYNLVMRREQSKDRAG